MPIYQIAPRRLRSAVKTFLDVFPHATLWYVDGHALLSRRRASRRSTGRLARKLADPKVRDDLASIGIRSPEDLLSHLLMGPRELRAYVEAEERVPVNTDDYPYLEYFVRAIFLHDGRQRARALGARDRSRRAGREHPTGGCGALSKLAAEQAPGAAPVTGFALPAILAVSFGLLVDEIMLSAIFHVLLGAETRWPQSPSPPVGLSAGGIKSRTCRPAARRTRSAAPGSHALAFWFSNVALLASVYAIMAILLSHR